MSISHILYLSVCCKYPAGRTSSSTPVLADHVFKELTLCTGAQSCWDLFGSLSSSEEKLHCSSVQSHPLQSCASNFTEGSRTAAMVRLSHLLAHSKHYCSLCPDWLFVGGYKEPGEDGPPGGCSPGPCGSSEDPVAGQQQHRSQGRRRRCSAALHGIRVNNNPYRSFIVWMGFYLKARCHCLLLFLLGVLISASTLLCMLGFYLGANANVLHLLLFVEIKVGR